MPPRVARGERPASRGQASQPLQFMGRSQNEFLIVLLYNVPSRRPSPSILPQHSIQADPIKFPNGALDAFSCYVAQLHGPLRSRLFGNPWNQQAALSLAWTGERRHQGASLRMVSVQSIIMAIVAPCETPGKMVGRKKKTRLSQQRFQRRFRREAERFVCGGRTRPSRRRAIAGSDASFLRRAAPEKSVGDGRAGRPFGLNAETRFADGALPGVGAIAERGVRESKGWRAA